MALTESNFLNIPRKFIDFSLINVIDNTRYYSQNSQNKMGFFLAFICNHCPYVIHIRECLFSMAKTYQSKQIEIIFINSNDCENYPQDGPSHMKNLAESYQFNFPFLFDEDQSVAKLYSAACTPDLYLYDANKDLAYHGRFDSSRPGSDVPVNGADLKLAFDSILSGKNYPQKQFPSMGCNIKWKK